MPPKPDNTSMASNTPRRSHQSPHSWHIHRNLCLIHIHLCPFPARSANSFMNIYGFIYDYFWPQKSAKRKTFMTSLMIIFDKKSHESPESIQDTLLKHSGNSWPYIQLIKLSNTRLLKLRNNATCCTRNNQFQHTKHIQCHPFPVNLHTRSFEIKK